MFDAGTISDIELFDSTPFTLDSLNSPGASNTPVLGTAASDPYAGSINPGDPVSVALYDSIAEPGDLFLGMMTSGTNALWIYGHDAPSLRREMPHLQLSYVPVAPNLINAGTDLEACVDPSNPDPSLCAMSCGTGTLTTEHEGGGRI